MEINSVLAGGGILAAILTILQLAPIKINPWSWLARSIGKAVNKDLIDEVSGLKKSVDKLNTDLEETKALSARTGILRFNDELLQGQRHSKEYFDQILEDISSYTKYCEAHKDFRNEKAKLAIENVERCYRKCMKDKDFI